MTNSIVHIAFHSETSMYYFINANQVYKLLSYIDAIRTHIDKQIIKRNEILKKILNSFYLENKYIVRTYNNIQ